MLLAQEVEAVRVQDPRAREQTRRGADQEERPKPSGQRREREDAERGRARKRSEQCHRLPRGEEVCDDAPAPAGEKG